MCRGVCALKIYIPLVIVDYFIVSSVTRGIHIRSAVGGCSAMKLVRYRNLLASLVFFFCLCLKAEASSIPIYEGNPNDMVNIISKIVNVWKVKSLPLRKKDVSICNIYILELQQSMNIKTVAIK